MKPMRAMLLEHHQAIEQSPLKLRDLPLPEPGPKEVRVRIQYCAICRTDLHVIEGELSRSKLPMIPGHQIIGKVDRLGSQAVRLKMGERVGIAWLHSTCGHCSYCRAGKENLCEESLFTGYDRNGGYAEYTTASEDFVYSIPSAIDDLSALPLLCAGIIGYRALSRSLLPDKGNLGIFGFGSSAHIVIQIAKARGAKVFVITRAMEHQKLALELGASWAGSDSRSLPVQLDSAILFAPAGELVPSSLEHLKRGGTLAIAGIHLSQIPTLDYQRHLFFEKDLRSVTANTRKDGHELLAEAARIPLRVHTRIYALEEANQALQDLKADRTRGTGVLRIS